MMVMSMFCVLCFVFWLVHGSWFVDAGGGGEGRCRDEQMSTP